VGRIEDQRHVAASRLGKGECAIHGGLSHSGGMRKGAPGRSRAGAGLRHGSA
jgi:hypothetical protein